MEEKHVSYEPEYWKFLDLNSESTQSAFTFAWSCKMTT